MQGSWSVGTVETVTRGADGLIREAAVKYCNPTESTPRFTVRSIRSLVRLFNVEDGHWRQDMEEVAKMLKSLEVDMVVGAGEVTGNIGHSVRLPSDPTLCKCCCASHCSLSLHVARGVKLAKVEDFELPVVEPTVDCQEEFADYDLDKLDDYVRDESSILDLGEDYARDSFMGLITAVNMDLKLEW